MVSSQWWRMEDGGQQWCWMLLQSWWMGLEMWRGEQMGGGGVDSGHVKWCHCSVKLEDGEEDGPGILGW